MADVAHRGITETDLWDDCCVVPPAGINPAGPDGTMTVITDAAGYLGCLQADAVGESCVVNLQLNHKYQVGTDIHPHIHIVRNDGSDNTGTCEFQADFRHLPLQGTASAWTGLIDGITTLQPADGADKTGLVEWELADATYHFGVSDIIVMIVRRKALATGSIALTSADMHIKQGQFGSRQEGAL